MIKGEMSKFILTMEGRKDKNGNLKVYYLPKSDRGGTFEVAGINDRYHPKAATDLKNLIEDGKHKEAEQYAIDYIEKYTSVTKSWHDDERVQAQLMDIRLNRGPTGAARILQHSLTVAQTYNGGLDGKVGSGTRTASNKHDALDLLPRLLLSRQWYERKYANRDESSMYWSGLTNRWVNAYQMAMSLGDPYKDLV